MAVTARASTGGTGQLVSPWGRTPERVPQGRWKAVTEERLPGGGREGYAAMDVPDPGVAQCCCHAGACGEWTIRLDRRRLTFEAKPVGFTALETGLPSVPFA